MGSVTPFEISRLFAAALALGIPFSGCGRGEIREVEEGPTVEELVVFYSPQSIRILPFTKPRSFDDDALPDGLAVSLRPLDSTGDPAKAVGTFIFELYSYRPAAGNHRGNLIQSWKQRVASQEDQKKFWERVTSTYEFHLSWEGMPVAPDKKYILAVSFQAPGGNRLFDEYEFEFRVDQKGILDTMKAAGS